MSTDVNVAKQITYNELESQIETAKAKLETFKGQAKGEVARVEAETYEAIAPKVDAMQQKLQELKKSSGEKWQQVKSDLAGQIAEFEQSAKTIESSTNVG